MPLLRALLAGLRLLTWRLPVAEWLNGGLLTVCALVLLNLGIDGLSLGVSGLGHTNGHTVSVAAWLIYFGRLAVICAMIAVLMGVFKRRSGGPVIVAFLAGSFWISCLQLALTLAARHVLPADPMTALIMYLAAMFAGFVGLFVVLWRAIPLALGKRARLLAAGTCLTTALALLLLPIAPVFGTQVYFRDAGLFPLISYYGEQLAIGQGWMAPPAPREAASDDYLDPYDDPVVLLGRQPELLSKAFERLQPSGSGHPRLYTVGFAGNASQAVFRREVQAVHQIFADRFDAIGHSIELINSTETKGLYPLASPHNLEATLDKLGETINKDNDVLFLFLTSHGGPGVFSVSFDDLPLRDLTPKALRGMLDRSGIKNRVIVISACYSGSFIKDLASDDTLIMTAARPDRTSFGCSDERDWTYFGDAYFNKALRRTHDFIAAFQTAKDLVGSWETRDSVKASEPQISVGDNIKAALARLEFPADAVEQDRH